MAAAVVSINMCSLTVKKLLEEANSTLQFTKVSYLLSHFIHVTFSSAAQSCPTLCDPMDCSTPGLPVHHQLPEFTQTHVHRMGDAIQPSHPLSSPSPPAFNLSQHQGFFPMSQFFASGGQSIGVSASASFLPMNIRDWFPLGLTGLISLLSKGLPRGFPKHHSSLASSFYKWGLWDFWWGIDKFPPNSHYQKSAQSQVGCM